jgi:hypothetical protein
MEARGKQVDSVFKALNMPSTLGARLRLQDHDSETLKPISLSLNGFTLTRSVRFSQLQTLDWATIEWQVWVGSEQSWRYAAERALPWPGSVAIYPSRATKRFVPCTYSLTRFASGSRAHFQLRRTINAPVTRI